MTARPIPRAAERNKSALARAQKDSYILGLSDHGMVEAFASRDDGSRYQMWASAGGFVDASREQLLVGFSCQCKAGANTYGITPCKHSALLADALYKAGVIAVDVDGAYVTTEKAHGAPSMYTLAGLLFPLRYGMTAEQAKTRLLAVLHELHADGFEIWGWDDGAIMVRRYEPRREGFDIEPMMLAPPTG